MLSWEAGTKKYSRASFERWRIAEIMMCNMENRTKPSQIIFPLRLLTYLNNSWDLGSQLDTLQLLHPFSDKTFYMDTLKFSIDQN